MGTAICEAPFFFIAHSYALITEPEKADGYTPPYWLAIVFGGVCWVAAGLWFLRKLLLRYFSDHVTTITLLLIGFATNLYFYVVMSAGMSHTYSFALFCILAYLCDEWVRSGRKYMAALIGIVSGIIVLVRPTNALVLLMPLCWGLKDMNIKQLLGFYKRQSAGIVAAVLLFGLLLLVQLSYWKYVTGNWLVYSYGGEHFNFSDPQLFNGLFSYAKGWFVYTPVALVAVAGLWPLYRRNRALALLLLLHLSLSVYLVFSWAQWSYGGSFGCRPLIEVFGLLALPLAALIDATLKKRKLMLTIPLFIFLSFVTVLNMFQSFQLKKNVIQWDFTDKKSYWETFGKIPE